MVGKIYALVDCLLGASTNNRSIGGVPHDPNNLMLTDVFPEKGVEKIYQTVGNVSSAKIDGNTACCGSTSVQAEGFARSASFIFYKSVEI